MRLVEIQNKNFLVNSVFEVFFFFFLIFQVCEKYMEVVELLPKRGIKAIVNIAMKVVVHSH